MCRASDVGWEFFDDGFEFLINPTSQSVCDAAGCQCDWARLPGCFMHLGGDVKVAELVLYFERSPEECIIIFRDGVMVVSKEFDDVLFDADDGL